MFHKLLLSSVAIIALTGLARAADMYVKAPPPVYVPSWTGCYIGGNLGYGRSVSSHLFSFDDVQPGEFQFTDQFSPKGFVGGFQGGCQLQTGQFLWGLEGDWDSFKNSDTRNWTDVGGGDNVSFSSSVNSLWSVRARFGIIASDVYHLYGTLGIGGARASYSFSALDTDSAANAAAFSANPTGIVAGVGAEMKVWNNWVVGLEYLHYAITSDTNIGTSLPATDIGPNVGNHWSFNGADVIRARASYLFNWGYR
jgi:outer membrane immunogenic protein